MLLLLPVALLALLALVVWLWKDCAKPSGYPPGPLWWPLLGNLPLISRLVAVLGFHHLVWEEMVGQYGPVVGLKLGLDRVVLVAGKDLIKEVSTREEFEGRPDGFFWTMRARGKRLGIVFSDGTLWAEHRRFAMLHLKNLGLGKSSMEELIVEEALSMVEWLNTTANTPKDMHHAFDISVFNIVWALMAGKRYDRDDVTTKSICKAVHDSFRLLDMSGGLLNQLPFVRYIIPNKSGYNEIASNLSTIYGFLTETIDEHKTTIRSGLDRDLIDSFLHEIEIKKHEDSTFTEKQLHVVCLDFLQAGTDTTSNSLEFLVLYMMQHPQVQKRLHEEIDMVLGRHRKPTLLDKARMPYTCAVLHEVQRKANVAPVGVAHRTLKDADLAGHRIPQNSTILMLLYNMHMSESWGDPHEFRPERFINDEGKLYQTENIAPFGFGRRRCIGEALARSNMFLFCTYLFQKLEVSNPLGFPDATFDIYNGVTLAPKPFKALWKPRSKYYYRNV